MDSCLGRVSRKGIELRSHVEGSGSHALLDFQNGDGNFIRIPFIRVWVP